MIRMQTIVCTSCGRGWVVESEDGLKWTSEQNHRYPGACNKCGKEGEPRGIPWARIPLRAKP